MSGNKQPALSAREMEVLALAWQCMEQQPKIDMNKLASLTGYTPGSASVTLGNIKRKLKLVAPSAGPTTTPKKGGSAKKRASASADADTPSKRHKHKQNMEPGPQLKKEKKENGRVGSEDEEDFKLLDGLDRFVEMGGKYEEVEEEE